MTTVYKNNLLSGDVNSGNVELADINFESDVVRDKCDAGESSKKHKITICGIHTYYYESKHDRNSDFYRLKNHTGHTRKELEEVA